MAKKINGRTQACSGALPGAKGDVRTEYNLIELKRTDFDSMILQNSWLKKIRNEAIKENRIPVLGIEIGGRTYYIVEACYFEGEICR